MTDPLWKLPQNNFTAKPCHMSCVTFHMSHVMFHELHVTSPIWRIKIISKQNLTRWWSYLGERRLSTMLPRLVSVFLWQAYLLNIPGWDWRRDDQAVCLNEVKYGLLAQVKEDWSRPGSGQTWQDLAQPVCSGLYILLSISYHVCTFFFVLFIYLYLLGPVRCPPLETKLYMYI